MAAEQFANNAITTLSVAIADGGVTTITVAGVAGFPTVPQFRIRIEDEILLVTALGASWTVSRGLEGTAAVGHPAGVTVTQVLTAGVMVDLGALYAALTSLGAGVLLGRGNTVPGAMQTITLGAGLSMSGTTLDVDTPGVTLTGDVTGSGSGFSMSFPTAIAAGAIGTAKLQDGSITTAKLQDGSVTTAKLADAAVTYAKIQGVSTGKVLLGRGDGGGGTVQEVGLGVSLSIAGTTLSSSVKAGWVSAQYFKSSDTTLSFVPGLTAGGFAAGEVYRFEAVLHIDSDVTGGCAVAAGGDGSFTVGAIVYQVDLAGTGTSAFAGTSRQTSLGAAISQVGSSACYCRIAGWFTVGSAGQFGIKFAQLLASGTSSVLAGSTLTVTRLA